MWKFTSDAQRTRVTAATLVVLLAGAFGFWGLQNHLGVTGGAIALPKLVWLAFALLFWFALPLFMVCDPRTPPLLERAFKVLLWLMLVRGVLELLMLYLWKNWSPLYGIAHDLLCMLALWYCLHQAWLGGDLHATPGNPRLARWLFAHGLVSSLMFVPEIGFAWYMRTHFVTHGDNAIYFVPDAAQHQTVLWVTTCVNIALALYTPLFLKNWLHAPRLSHRT